MVNTAASLPARPGLQYGRSDSVFKVSCMSCSHNTRAAIKCEGRKKKPKKTPHQRALKLDWLRLPHLSDMPGALTALQVPAGQMVESHLLTQVTKRERRKGRVMLLLLKMTSEASFAYRCQDSAALQPDWLPACVCVCVKSFSPRSSLRKTLYPTSPWWSLREAAAFKRQVWGEDRKCQTL